MRKNSKTIKVWERSPLSCSHPTNRYDYDAHCCGKCGSKEIAAPALCVSEFSDDAMDFTDAMDFAAKSEAEILAKRV